MSNKRQHGQQEVRTMIERSIEQRLVAETKKRGGLAQKFMSLGMDGVPDRIVLMHVFGGGISHTRLPKSYLLVLQF